MFEKILFCPLSERIIDYLENISGDRTCAVILFLTLTSFRALLPNLWVMTGKVGNEAIRCCDSMPPYDIKEAPQFSFLLTVILLMNMVFLLYVWKICMCSRRIFIVYCQYFSYDMYVC